MMLRASFAMFPFHLCSFQWCSNSLGVPPFLHSLPFVLAVAMINKKHIFQYAEGVIQSLVAALVVSRQAVAFVLERHLSARATAQTKALLQYHVT